MSYTPGYSDNVTKFMSRRTVDSHAAFIKPLLRDNLTVLDLGCGPGTLTLDLAQRLPNGSILALDLGDSQIETARKSAQETGIENVSFEVSDASKHPLPDNHFDLIFSHALFEHLPNPHDVLQHVLPALKPGGHIALRSPDWGGWVLHPETTECQAAIDRYEEIQKNNGGNTRGARQFGEWLTGAGFKDPQPSASYEIYPSAQVIAEYLAQQLERDGEREHAAVLRNWAKHPHSLFAQSWFECIATR